MGIRRRRGSSASRSDPRPLRSGASKTGIAKPDLGNEKFSRAVLAPVVLLVSNEPGLAPRGSFLESVSKGTYGDDGALEKSFLARFVAVMLWKSLFRRVWRLRRAGKDFFGACWWPRRVGKVFFGSFGDHEAREKAFPARLVARTSQKSLLRRIGGGFWRGKEEFSCIFSSQVV